MTFAVLDFTMPLRLSSPVLEDGSPIPKRYTADGESVSPPLRWSGAPLETQEYALIFEDPDTPTAKPFVHWIIYGLSANTSTLPEGLPTDDQLGFPVLARQGLNGTLHTGYTGPNPTLWHPPHRYVFRLFALRSALPLLPGAGREEFYKALQPYLLEEARLTGFYEKPKEAKRRSGLLIAGALGLTALVLATTLRSDSRPAA